MSHLSMWQEGKIKRYNFCLRLIHQTPIKFFTSFISYHVSLQRVAFIMILILYWFCFLIHRRVKIIIALITVFNLIKVVIKINYEKTDARWTVTACAAKKVHGKFQAEMKIWNMLSHVNFPTYVLNIFLTFSRV